MTEINEPIQVASTFRNRQMQPVLFLWNHRQYTVDAVTDWYVERRGTDQVHHFAVTSGGNLFHLTFDPESFDWQVVANHSSA